MQAKCSSFDHLLPIWSSLPNEYRGPLFARSRAFDKAEKLGLPVTYGAPKDAEIVVVASYEDHVVVAPSPTVMVNHGVGQSYKGSPESERNPSYSGGRGRERIVLFLEPSEYAASATRETTDAKVAIVGCPRLDPWHPAERRTDVGPSIVTFSFHADIHVCPETRWAEPYYEQSIIDLIRSNSPYEIWGHIHPRFRTWGEKFWTRLGIPFHEDFNDILDYASLYVCDNSSTLYEFASTGHSVVCLNAPYYRRDVHHGLRFWDAVPGLQVDDPESLPDGIKHALEDPADLREIREAAVSVAYAATDGRATERAVKALVDFAGNY